MQYKDYYKILGVSRDASTAEIQRAYRKLARQFHPDVNKEPEAAARFVEINEAKEVLKDPEKRKLYDTYGRNWNQADQQTPPGWQSRADQGAEDFSQSFRFRGSGSEQDFGEFSDFFNTLFGQGQATGHSANRSNFYNVNAPGSSHEADITLSLNEVFHGAAKTISFQTYEADEYGQLEAKTRTLEVKIPRGVANGSIIRLAGQGEKGRGSGAAGDLLLRIKIMADARFRPVGHDLHTTVAISPWEAALGAKIPIKTVDNTVTLTIPAGTQNGRRFRLKGKGMPKKGTGAGDLIVETEIHIPRSLSNKERQLFEELTRTSSFDPRNESRQRAKNDPEI